MARLSEPEITARLRDLAGWTREGDAIARQFTFPSFADAIAFVVRLAFDAEAADHHPDLDVRYRRVGVRYSTHSVGGLTDRDFEGARTADRIAGALGGGA